MYEHGRAASHLYITLYAMRTRLCRFMTDVEDKDFKVLGVVCFPGLQLGCLARSAGFGLRAFGWDFWHCATEQSTDSSAVLT